MNAEKLVIRTYRSLEELQPLVASWKTLLAQYPLATTFSTPEWLFPWWRNFGKNQELLVAGFFADAQLVGLADGLRVDLEVVRRRWRRREAGRDDDRQLERAGAHRAAS